MVVPDVHHSMASCTRTDLTPGHLESISRFVTTPTRTFLPSFHLSRPLSLSLLTLSLSPTVGIKSRIVRRDEEAKPLLGAFTHVLIVFFPPHLQ